MLYLAGLKGGGGIQKYPIVVFHIGNARLIGLATCEQSFAYQPPKQPQLD